MRSIKTLMVFLFCLFATIGNAGSGGFDQKENFRNAINFLSKLVAYKYQLSTTGYQAAMIKDTSKLTPERAQQYKAKAKATFPNETLKNMALLQSTYINKIPETGQLSDPHHMNGEKLTSCLNRCREKGFANCEMQSLEIAIHLYALGFKKFKIWSNKAISHNYVVLDSSTFFPRGAIVDSHLGYGFRELDMKMITTYKHFEKNIMVVQNMMDWLDKNANTYANKLWLSVILEKFYPGKGPTPLATIR